jgi:hypothetical protein
VILNFKQTLQTRAGYEVVLEKVTDTVITWEGRVGAAAKAQWQKVRGQMLRAARDHGFNVDISMHFILKGDVDAYSHRLIVTASSKAALEQNVKVLNDAVIATPRVMPVLEEFALTGASPLRNQPAQATANGLSRGASPINPRSGGGSPYRALR